MRNNNLGLPSQKAQDIAIGVKVPSETTEAETLAINLLQPRIQIHV